MCVPPHIRALAAAHAKAVVQIPFSAFVLTNVGEVSYDQIQMYRERVRTIGVSLLGGNSGVEGSYELGIDSIFAVNEEDVPSDAAPSECLSTRTPCCTRLTRRMIAEQEPSSGTQWERPAI